MLFKSMIALEDLHKYYGTKDKRLHVLKGLSFTIAEGELVSIMGSSGSGKSTLLNVLGLLDGFDSGRYRLADVEIHQLSATRAAELRNQFIGFVFQSFNLLSFKDATENVALPLYYRKQSRRARKKRAEELLELVGLGDRLKHKPSELSGGQKQRVAIARALACDPKVIFADEPTGALDSNTTDEIMAVFKEVHARGKTLIIVTHEQEIAAQTERLIHLSDGNIINDSAQVASGIAE